MTDRLPVPEIELEFVDSPDQRQRLCDWAREQDGWVGLDVETTGLQPYGEGHDTVRLVQFGNENVGWAVPFESVDLIRTVLRLIEQAGGRLVGHNAIFDETFLIESGVPEAEGMACTQIAHRLSHPHMPHGLKPIAASLYGSEVRTGEKWLKKEMQKNRWTWATVPVDHPAYWGYGAMDAVLTARLADDLVLDRIMGTDQYQREAQVARSGSEMSSRGLRVDEEAVARLGDEYDRQMWYAASALAESGIENPASGDDVRAALLERGWEPDPADNTPTGKASVGKDVLSQLDGTIPRLVLEYRKLSKYNGTYVKPLSEAKGRIHPIVSTMGANTGRMAIQGGLNSAPIHQFPKGPDVRGCIVADEGDQLWAIDYTGQEMRLFCAFSQDEALTETVLSGADVHGRIAEHLFGVDYTPEQRSKTKNGLYAYCYGAQAARLSSTTGAPKGATEEAIASAFPGLAEFSKQVSLLAERREFDDGYAWAKTYGGRRVAVPSDRHFTLVNYLMQGSGADMMKEAIVRIEDEGYGYLMRLVVHDELLLSVPGGWFEAPEEIAQLMSTEFRGVPFDVHVSGPGKNWGEL